METIFYITFNIRTSGGYECYGKFHIGNDKNFAHALFKKLKGTQQVDSDNVLYIDFIETRKGLPVNINMLTCTLQDMADNCKIITKEIFKLVNLK